MPGESARPPRMDWRRDTDVAARRRDADPDWRKGNVPVDRPPIRRHWLKVGLGVGGLLVLLVVLFLLVLMPRPPKPSFVIALAAGQEENLAVPHNAYGLRGAQGLIHWAKNEARGTERWWQSLGTYRGFRVHSDAPVVVKAEKDWQATLSPDAIRGITEKTIILYLGMHGGVDEGQSGKGKAYLLRQDADPADLTARTSLSDLFDRLAIDDLKSKNIILILDATQVPAHWPLGMIHNDFARQLEQEFNEHRAKLPHVFILSASEADQVSWGAEDWGQTFFMQFVLHGLKGAADKNNQRVTLHELAQYVRKNVEHYAWHMRGASQTPVLLPRDPNTEKRASEIELTAVKEAPTGPPLTAKATGLSSDVETAWGRRQELDRWVPHPSAYAPQLWRQYLDTLLRAEQLERAGLTPTKLRTDLNELPDRIRLASRINLAAATNTLGIPAVTGRKPTSMSDKDISAQIWDAKDEDVVKNIRKLLDRPSAAPPPPGSTSSTEGAPKAGATPPASTTPGTPKDTAPKPTTASTPPVPSTGATASVASPNRTVIEAVSISRQELGLQICELLLNKVEKDPSPESLRKAVRLLTSVLSEANVAVPPAEIQYLFILQRDLPNPAPPPDLVRLAIRVRRLAELAALGTRKGDKPEDFAYSERCWRWVQSRIEKADDLRRPAEDRLLSTRAQDWADARKGLTDAAAIYEAAQEDAQTIGKALRLRDRALATLPYYTQWHVSRPPMAKNLVDDEKRLLQLWDQVHQLGAKLEYPDRQSIENIRVHLQGNGSGGGMAKTFQSLVIEFEKFCKKLVEEGATQDKYRDVEAALLVPTIDVPLRQSLRGRFREMSEHLLSRLGESGQGPEPDAEPAGVLVQRQGRLALAWLGKGDGGEPQPTVEDKKPTPQEAGIQIGAAWRGIVAGLNKQAEQRTKLEQLANGLLDGDRVGRLHARGTILTPKLKPGEFKPAEEHRRYWLQQLWLWQAQRTWKDHYYEMNGTDAYYTKAGSMYLTDLAGSLVGDDPIKSPFPKEVASRKTELDQLGTLAPDGTEEWKWTSEQRLDLKYYLRQEPRALVPPGFPVLWVEKKDNVIQPQGSETPFRKDGKDERRMLSFKKERSEDAMPCQLGLSGSTNDTNPSAIPRKIEVTGRYRGQIISKDVGLPHFPIAERIAGQHELPAKVGGVTVRASDEVHRQFAPSNGAIVVVLDCSGSMCFDLPKNVPYTRANQTQTRFYQAIKSLEEAMGVIPEGTRFSLWIFAQKSDKKDVEATIQRLPLEPGFPRAWGGPAHARQISDSLLNPAVVTPFDDTPLVRAMWTAKRDLEGVTGFKTMLVLTDGMDNRFAEKDTELRAIAPTIPELFRKEFRDIRIHMVGFDLQGKDKGADAQFQAALKTVGGTFTEAAKKEQLVPILRDRLKQELRFEVRTYSNEPTTEGPVESKLIGDRSSKENWAEREAPNSYEVLVRTNRPDRPLKKTIALRQGDALLLKLVTGDASTSLRFERLVYSAEEGKDRWAVAPTDKDGSKWHLAVLQNAQIQRPNRPPAVEMMVTLDKEPGKDEDPLQMLDLRNRVWFDLEPLGQSPSLPVSLRWSYLPYYPAPAWGLDVPEWPAVGTPSKLMRPRLRAWWSANPVSATRTLERGDIVPLDNLPKKQIDGDRVIIEEAVTEKHLVETRPGVRELRDCFVIRLSFKDQPWAVQPEGSQLTLDGFEHHYFLMAKKYTGKFWPVTRELLDRVQRLHFIDLGEFKAAAERSGRSAASDDLLLSEPQSGQVRPPRKIQEAQ